jgi:hypothetical protein
MPEKPRDTEPSNGLPQSEDRTSRWALPHIEEALRGLQFGQVTVIVQDGVVVQVDRTERRRFQRRHTNS